MRIRWEYKAILFCVWTALWFFVPSRSIRAETWDESPGLVQSLAHHIMAVSADYYDLPQEAVREYQQAIRFNPDSYLSRLRLGAHLAKVGMLDDALEQLTKVSQLNPEEIQARYLLALIYSAQKKFDKATVEYEYILRALSVEDPENINLFFYLGQLYYAQNQYDKAIAQFQKIIQLNPQNVEMMNFIGALFVELGNESDAVKMFKRVLGLDVNNDLALNSLGYIYAQQGVHLDEALNLVQRALGRVPNSAAYQDSLGLVYYKQGRYEKALKVLLKANEILVDPIILEHLGDVYLVLQDYIQARSYWDRALKLTPGEKSILEKINRLEILQRESVERQVPVHAESAENQRQ